MNRMREPWLFGSQLTRLAKVLIYKGFHDSCIVQFGCRLLESDGFRPQFVPIRILYCLSKYKKNSMRIPILYVIVLNNSECDIRNIRIDKQFVADTELNIICIR